MKCKCKTKSGKPCSRNAEQNSKYCWQHADVATLAPGPPGPSPQRKSPQRKSPKKMTASERKTQAKFCRCVLHVKEKGSAYNPWAVCTASVGRVNNSCKEFE